MARYPAREKNEKPNYLCGDDHAYRDCRTICEDEIGVHRGILWGQALLLGMLAEKHEETVQQAMERRERCSPIGLVDSSRSWDSDNGVLCSPIFAGLQKVVFEIFRFPCTEFIPRGHDVGAMCVLVRIERYLSEHVEHLSCMTSTAQDNEQVDRFAPVTDFGDCCILRVCERGDDSLTWSKASQPCALYFTKIGTPLTRTERRAISVMGTR